MDNVIKLGEYTIVEQFASTGAQIKFLIFI